MRIGIVCYPTLGGSGVVATELGQTLAECGHDVHFITYEVPFRLRMESPRIHFHKVEINRYDLFEYPDYALTLAVKIAQVSDAYQLDILHVHYAIPHATSAYLAKQLTRNCKPAIITTLHGTDISLVGKDPAYSEIVKFSINHSDRVTAVSNDLAKMTNDFFQIEAPIEVIHNFFIPDKELIGKKPMRGNFVKEDEKLLCHSSNFRSVKRAQDVIKIFHLVKQQVPSKLLLIGTGPQIEEVHHLVKELQLEKDVYFLGKQVEVDPYIASSDLVLLPSSQESFGLVALEAMAYGVPVVATCAGGLPEVVLDGITGFLAPVGDVEAMAEYSLKVLSDNELYKKMSIDCIERSSQAFSVKKILPKYLKVYEEACKNLS
ncbi:MAG: N-acetyl-alpha-D-glucosaminyl L-malate synthase BshA [Waddliaceae bacterium]